MKRIAYRGIRLAEEGDVWVEDADGMMVPEEEYGLDEDELVEQAEEELEEREEEAKRRRSTCRRAGVSDRDLESVIEDVYSEEDYETYVKMLENGWEAYNGFESDHSGQIHLRKPICHVDDSLGIHGNVIADIGLYFDRPQRLFAFADPAGASLWLDTTGTLGDAMKEGTGQTFMLWDDIDSFIGTLRSLQEHALDDLTVGQYEIAIQLAQDVTNSIRASWDGDYSSLTDVYSHFCNFTKYASRKADVDKSDVDYVIREIEDMTDGRYKVDRDEAECIVREEGGRPSWEYLWEYAQLCLQTAKRAQEYEDWDERLEEGCEQLLEDLNAQPMSGLAEYINRDVLSDPKTTRELKALYDQFSEFRLNGVDTSFPVTSLYPTQNEIGLSNSLAWPLGGKADVASYFSSPITCGRPIVTYNGTYILDGHHRWSQAYIMNPDISITAIDFTGIDVDPEQVLRDLQGEIASQLEFVPQAEGDPVSNVYDMSEDDVRTWIDNELEPDSAVEHDLLDELGMDRDGAIEYLVENAMMLKANNAPVSSAPDRKFMPQTDDIDIEEFDDGSNI